MATARLQLVLSPDGGAGGWMVLRGVLSDALAAILLGALLGRIGWRWPGWALASAILYAYAGDSVNIRVNHAHISFAQAHVLGQSEFLVSMFSPEVLRNLLAYLVAFAAAWQMAGRWHPAFATARLVAVALPLFLCLLWWPVAITRPDWVQRSLPEDNVAQWLHRAPAATYQDAGALAPFLSHDLSGELTVARPKAPANVLLIVLESMSGQFIERGWTPYIAALSKRTLFYPNFVDLQRQTHNGMYAMLCGDLPSLSANHSNGMVERTNKWAEVVRTGTPYACLPRRLRDAGYRTVFMKACDLNYVSTNIFAPRAGFDEAYDDSSFRVSGDERRHWYGWGAPDDVLFGQALQRMRALQGEGKPWFMTLLTAGTHQPYNVSPGYASHFPSGEQAAFAFMDASLGRLMQQLDGQGILKNTVVLITGDESAADIGDTSDAAGLLAANWGTLLVRLPTGEARVDPHYFRQSDIMLSVLDYLGLPSGNVEGRSLFRSYPGFRPLMFANTILNRWDVVPSPGRLVMCSSHLDNCGYYTLNGSLFHATAQPAPPDPDIAGYRDAARASDARLDSNNLLFSWNKPKKVSGIFTLLQFLRLQPDAQLATRMTFHLQTPADNRHDIAFHFNLQKTRGPGEFRPSGQAIYRHPLKIAGGKDVFMHVMIPPGRLAQDTDVFAAVRTWGDDKVTIDQVEVTRVSAPDNDNRITFTTDGTQ